jgi:dipeptidase D
MTGANMLSEGFMTGKLLLNLDSEQENQIFIGCAGGMDTVALWHYTTQPTPADYYFARVSVGGLLGGHSGGDIHLGRANANKVLARFLTTQPGLLVSDIRGGNLRNAIAREAYAVIGVPAARRDQLVADLNKFAAMVKVEVAGVEPSFKMSIETVDAPAEVIDPNVTCRLIQALIAAPHGVIGMSHSMPGLVETSTNLASVRISEPGTIRVETSQRSSVESQKRMIAQMVKTVFDLAGAEVTQGQGYPGWAANPNSRMVKLTEAAYRKVYGGEPETMAIHAGLECGLLGGKYPDMEMISFGPTLRSPHTPNERCNIPSVARFWEFLKTLLEEIPEK